MVLSNNLSPPSKVPREISFYLTVTTVVLSSLLSLLQIDNEAFRIIDGILLIFVLTYATGLSLVRIMRIDAFDRATLSDRIIAYSIIGLCLNSVIFLLAGFLHIFTNIFIITYLIVILFLYGVRSNGKISKIGNIRDLYLSLVALASVLIFGMLLSLWIHPLDSFPDITGWDLFTHILTVRTIENENGLTELNLQYLPAVHYYYAAESLLLNIDPFVVYWYSIYFIFVIGGFSLYLLGEKISQNKLVGVATAIIGISLGSSNETLGFLFPYSSTFGIVLVTVSNAMLLTKPSIKSLFLFNFAIFLIYPMASVANLIVFTGVLFYRSKQTTFYKSILLASVVLIIGSYFGGQLLDRFATPLSTARIWEQLQWQYFGGIGLILTLIGIYFILVYKHVQRNEVLILLSSLMLFIIIISGVFNFGFRYEEFFRANIALVMGYAIGFSSTELPKIALRKLRREF